MHIFKNPQSMKKSPSILKTPQVYKVLSPAAWYIILGKTFPHGHMTNDAKILFWQLLYCIRTRQGVFGSSHHSGSWLLLELNTEWKEGSPTEASPGDWARGKYLLDLARSSSSPSDVGSSQTQCRWQVPLQWLEGLDRVLFSMFLFFCGSFISFVFLNSAF